MLSLRRALRVSLRFALAGGNDTLSESHHCAPVAQLDRAVASEATGREFESLRAHHHSETTSIVKVPHFIRDFGCRLRFAHACNTSQVRSLRGAFAFWQVGPLLKHACM